MCVRRIVFAVVFFCASSLFGSAGSAAVVYTVFERDAGGTSGNEVAVVTYGSYPILVNNSSSITQFSAVDVDPAFSIAGATLDSGGLRVLFERDAGGTSGNELALVSYPSIDAFVNNSSSITQFSAVDIDPAFSVHGFTYDGTAYRVLFERDAGGTGGNELAVVSFDSIDALVNNTSSITQFSAVDVDPAFSVAGFDFDGSSYQVLFERDAGGTSGNELALVTYATLDALIDNTSSLTQFSLIDIDPAFSMHGVASTWLPDGGIGSDPGQGGGGSGEGGGGPGPMGVGEPPSGLLFAAGLLGLGLLGRYRPVGAA